MGNFVAFRDFPSQLSSPYTKSTFRTKTEVDGEEVNNRLKLFIGTLYKAIDYFWQTFL